MSKNETISEQGLEMLKAALLEATDLVCRDCGADLHLVDFKQRGYCDRGGAVGAGALSCPNQRWWKVWQAHRTFWVEVTVNGYCVWESRGFPLRDVFITKGDLDVPWYKILVGEHY